MSFLKYPSMECKCSVLLAVVFNRTYIFRLVTDSYLKKKELFLVPFFSNVPTFQRPLSLRGGVLGRNGPAIKKITFFAASLTNLKQNEKTRN